MRKSPKFSPEVVERAVSMVLDAKDHERRRRRESGPGAAIGAADDCQAARPAASRPRAWRDVLVHRLQDKQEKFFRKLLGRKDEVNCGARSTTLGEAQQLLAELDEFAVWAEGHA